MTGARFESEQPLRIGTRGSALALAQTELVVKQLRTAFPELAVEVRVIRTAGDVDRTTPLTELGGRGVFTNAIEDAILRGEVDAAVHSAKDLPTRVHPLAPVVALPRRDDARDVLVSRHGTTLDRLPGRPTIGTSSRRREAQIRRLRPDARLVNIRGNVDTRLRKAASEEYDAVVLAAAGIGRMGWEDRISETFAVERMVPSPGQGALAVQARADGAFGARLAAIDDPAVSIPVGIERAFLAAVGAGCSYPVGAYVEQHGDGYRLVAMIGDERGERLAFGDELLAGDACRHAAEVAFRLHGEVSGDRAGAAWSGWRGDEGDLAGCRVVVTRPQHQAQPLLAALREQGAIPLHLPTIRIEPVADATALDAALREAATGRFAWLAFTSANAVSVIGQRLSALELRPQDLGGIAVAAVGRATAAAAEDAGLVVAITAETPSAAGLAAALRGRIAPGQRVLYPRSAIGGEALPAALRQAGLGVTAIDAYNTEPETEFVPEVLEQVQGGDVDAVVFASPSSVRNFAALVGAAWVASACVPVFCAGAVTAAAAHDAGFRLVEVSAEPSAAGIVGAIAAHWRERAETTREAIHEPYADLVGRSAE